MMRCVANIATYEIKSFLESFGCAFFVGVEIEQSLFARGSERRGKGE